ncbi:hypothetical protein ASG56_05135 [Rhodococcus sp. Leaf7]|uniref:PIG-L deacetylase family protein n=1 Tax=unclassified Rhodococcus (in: high G+C Gram-positive bacteria) TaxID=192944 RepID=UPI0006FA14AD|nr:MULTISPECIES: PIG-L family deacetylase [unclassified Rhodococcus (in: high G+C Gram-positive bacteria)]KQU07851.1 hypothetical protein ASG56_05135 [Rhodococcus sp. Leaf7]KQU43369.1 hypothetical protein ASG64_05135 [Rhodococcus sp. Leaf247]
MSVERFADRPIAARGTPESVWLQAGTVFPLLDDSACSHLVVVAPHPDDEVLGVGGWAAARAAAGAAVTLVAVTDGGASHTPRPSRTRRDLERLRVAESDAAREDLGVRDSVRLGVPDGQVDKHERELAERLHDVLTTLGGGENVWCATTLRTDGHPDHEAVGRASVDAATAAGCVVVEYPIWMWHWAEPADPQVPWTSARTVLTSDESYDRKLAAVSRFHTQIRADDDDEILPPWVLERLTRRHETVFV